ncbi:hypothetical protein FA95DRAFT_1457468, partial [Auriscalpium vulgare]
MLKAAKTYNAQFAVLKLSKELKRQLPAWYHLGTDKPKPIAAKSKCLMHVHKVRTTADVEQIAERLLPNRPGRPHYAVARCACAPCKADTRRGCRNPHKCAKEAQEILRRMNAKTNPETASPKDGLTLTKRRRDKNIRAMASKTGVVLFNPTVTASKSFADCFRVFTDPGKMAPIPAHR